MRSSGPGTGHRRCSLAGCRIDGAAGAKKGNPAAFPVARGTLLGLSPGKHCYGLMATFAESMSAGPTSRGSEYASPHPHNSARRPWTVGRRRACHYRLSKMDWNNDALMIRSRLLSDTQRYSHR